LTVAGIALPAASKLTAPSGIQSMFRQSHCLSRRFAVGSGNKHSVRFETQRQCHGWLAAVCAPVLLCDPFRAI
jgi:hypothetical protein